VNPLRHIIWKEFTLHLRPAGRIPRQHILHALPLLMVIGAAVILGPAYLDAEALGIAIGSAIVLLFSFAAILPMTFAGDTFAGERERHTLETVLTTPITPRRLWWGKALAQVLILGALLAFSTLIAIFLIVFTPIPPAFRVIFLIALPFALPAMFLVGLLSLLSAHVASLRSATLKETNTRFGIYMMTYGAIGLVPTAIITPTLIAFSGTPQLSPAMLYALVFGQVLSIAGFLGYLGHMIHQLIRHTDPHRFQIEV
jgi:ABC-2 type transport system permease protein